jgi:hypothetical protein
MRRTLVLWKRRRALSIQARPILAFAAAPEDFGIGHPEEPSFLAIRRLR